VQPWILVLISLCYCHTYITALYILRIMTNKVRHRKYASTVMVVTLLIIATITIEAVLNFGDLHQAIGQGQNGSPLTIGNPNLNITGSLSITPILAKVVASQVHVSLVNATMTAVKSVGNNSNHAVSAHLGIQNGFLVYTVWVIDSEGNFRNLVIDAGNGKVLLNQQIQPSTFGPGTMMFQGGMAFPPPPPGFLFQGTTAPPPGTMAIPGPLPPPAAPFVR
jgi:uncharacterized membrane protein YkoI